MKNPPETPSYDDDITPEQYEAIRKFSEQFDMTGFIEDDTYEAEQYPTTVEGLKKKYPNWDGKENENS